MTNHPWRVVAAELIKLRSLPAVPLTVGTTVMAAAGLAYVADAAQVITYAQAGFVLLGVLTVAAERASASLVAVPGRVLLVAGKLAAYLTVAVPFAAATCLVAGRPSAAAYLVLVGVLAFAVALLVRGLLVALGGVLALVFVLSPLLASLTEYAAYLPDLAGARMFRPGPPDVLTPAQGAAVLIAWTACLLGAAVAVFARRDA